MCWFFVGGLVLRIFLSFGHVSVFCWSFSIENFFFHLVMCKIIYENIRIFFSFGHVLVFCWWFSIENFFFHLVMCKIIYENIRIFFHLVMCWFFVSGLVLRFFF